MSMLAVRASSNYRLDLLPQIEQIEPTPLFDQSAVFDTNDGCERDRHMLASWRNALKGALMGAAYRQAIRDSVTLRESVCGPE